MAACKTCRGEGVLLCEGPYCTDSSHDALCRDCEGSGEVMDKHNCPGLSACVNHPKIHVSKLRRTIWWVVWQPTDSDFATRVFDSFEEALDEANKRAVKK